MPEQHTYSLDRLYFYLTEGCNLACRHCWLAPPFDPAGEKGRILPVECFETAIREALPLGLNAVKLTGGEPLLHPCFCDLLGIVRKHGLNLNIESNGLLCTPDIAAQIADCPSPFVSVSLDAADAQIHDRIRGVAGAFDKAVQAVQNLIHCGIRPQIVMSLMRSNAGQIRAMIQMAGELGAESLKFNIVQPVARGRGLLERGESLRVEEIIRLGKYVENELSAECKLRVIFDWPMAFRALSRIATGEASQVCGILGILGVIPSGHYALCGIGTHVQELVFGTVGKDALSEIWNTNPVLTQLRQGLPKDLEGICSRCLMKARCLGSCIAQTVYRTSSLRAPFWFCEEAEHKGLFPPSRVMP